MPDSLHKHNVQPLRIADAQRAIRHVFVRDLKLNALIGVYPEEKTREQPIMINIDLTVREGVEPSEDNLRNVVSYEVMVNHVKAILGEGHINLVETLAERIAQAALSDDRVEAARVRIEKLTVIPEAASVGVEIERIKTGA